MHMEIDETKMSIRNDYKSSPFGEISLELFQELSSGPPELSSESMSHLSEHFMKKGRIKKHGS